MANGVRSQRAEPRFALTLHIGMGKTGTTSLQSFCVQNRSRLAEAGWLYPRTPGHARHKMFGAWTRPDRRLANALTTGRIQRYESREQLRREVPRRLLAEVEDSGLTQVMMSDEALYGSSEESLKRLRQFTDEHVSDLRVICYLRRQDDHVVSRYQQRVKVRETRTLAQRVAEIDLSKIYDYHSHLRTWLRIVEPDELIVRRFERGRFHNGSLYDDFVDAARLGIPTDDLPPHDRNESLDAESVEFLRLLNLYRAEHGDADDLPDNSRLTGKLAKLGKGPTLTLPDADLDRFMARWAESNDLVVRDLLGDPGGPLFSTARKDSGTTTEQRLDPSRLDHFLGGLRRLPDRLEGPLRRIAEREAAR